MLSNSTAKWCLFFVIKSYACRIIIVEGYFNESLLATDKKIRPKAYIASWKDIGATKKIKLKLKKVLNGMMVMN
ncbi:hypothetical protein ACV56Z_05815 [Staphylococcus aureus]